MQFANKSLPTYDLFYVTAPPPHQGLEEEGLPLIEDNIGWALADGVGVVAGLGIDAADASAAVERPLVRFAARRETEDLAAQELLRVAEREGVAVGGRGCAAVALRAVAISKLIPAVAASLTVVPGTWWNQENIREDSQRAIFGEATWPVSDKTELTVGLRAYDNQADFDAKDGYFGYFEDHPTVSWAAGRTEKYSKDFSDVFD